MTQPRHETYTLMKARARKRSDSCRAESIRDTSTLPTPVTTRSVVRQVCIGDMEEELHRAFAMARYIFTRVTRKFTRYKPHDKFPKNSFVSKVETPIPVLNYRRCAVVDAVVAAGYQGGPTSSTSEITMRTPDSTIFATGTRSGEG